MIIWEINDVNGDLVTKCFSERRAQLYIQKAERGSKRKLPVRGLRVDKVFQAEDRELRPLKKWMKKGGER